MWCFCVFGGLLVVGSDGIMFGFDLFVEIDLLSVVGFGEVVVWDVVICNVVWVVGWVDFGIFGVG